mmetsp:Transcript_17954/g.32785  ORF Transcript_17954/g.32785 Transcript_17954/m.32785 type:complete len:207 (-) Transcript_17954:595-1215(-)
MTKVWRIMTHDIVMVTRMRSWMRILKMAKVITTLAHSDVVIGSSVSIHYTARPITHPDPRLIRGICNAAHHLCISQSLVVLSAILVVIPIIFASPRAYVIIVLVAHAGGTEVAVHAAEVVLLSYGSRNRHGRRRLCATGVTRCRIRGVIRKFVFNGLTRRGRLRGRGSGRGTVIISTIRREFSELIEQALRHANSSSEMRYGNGSR